ncbi:hypothetical protein HMI54_013836 [Coelomomyces lativittatus]|nr:hypothetical protein HMI54_013836 [Coelomomyces lativittatus]KAJ1497243.1 hypothetical protein HMI56_005724 [Coelomomyces lativittatus]KAJ1506317.1 hypothetical protein HMI55_001226 [Coelomomyces lativittatus]
MYSGSPVHLINLNCIILFFVFLFFFRPSINASRGGTRGFRAPEVLIKLPNQTSAIDIWSSGVILLSFLTRKILFFDSPDDTEALQEISMLFGYRQLRRFAAQHQRILLCKLPNVQKEGIPLRDLIYSLNPTGFAEIPEEAFDFLKRVLSLSPTDRITATDGLRHPWLRGIEQETT